jgi:general stress protein YciG
MWHYANWKLWGKVEDFCAWKGLSGMIGKEEMIGLMKREGTLRSIETRKERGTGFWDPEIQKRGGSAGIRQKIEKDPDYQSRVGKKGGEKCRDEKIGVCGWSFEEKSSHSREVSSRLYLDPDHPELGNHRASTLSRMQKKRGFPNKPENRIRVSRV